MAHALGRMGVASQHAIASYYGMKVLENGGNAFDAAITVSSIISLVLPFTSGLGGDAFLLGYTSEGEIIGYNASGYSPRNFRVDDFIREKPVRGPLTITVPDQDWPGYGDG